MTSRGVYETTEFEAEIRDLELVMHNQLRQLRLVPDLEFREILRDPWGDFPKTRRNMAGI
jgi:hypothetical protein